MSAAQRRAAAGAAPPEPADSTDSAAADSADSAADSTGAADTRRRLIDAAWDMLAAGGPEAVTMRGVGERVGVSRTAPYRHFRGKDDLLRAVALRMMERMWAEVVGNLPGPDTAPEEVPGALLRAFSGYVRLGLEAPEHYRLAHGEHRDHVDEDDLHDSAARMMEECVRAVAEGQRLGAIRPGDPWRMVLLSTAALHGVITLALSGHLAKKLSGHRGGRGEPTDVERELHLLLADLVAGLTAPGLRPE
ncbi:TetR/AcrR family transcriptional regulator [Streptomonospora sp. S1-112]|uniref:TetR/AcrR family transcriptional regulator n=1 Tax=Streptomonospora mangrovi TaxID=2883123 RepID=A0A9X3NPC2_9ACTN|nr:TetR/AcrR family transcriptional regulator [Streptomonospora mangrovi]MDA0566740.1 TetR/AcrR family transcriptional regulator [Streptomonospora mangrovi]